MGQDAAIPEHVMRGHSVRRSDGNIDSTTGALLAGPLFGLDEDPRNDFKDGAYRLYTRFDVLFDCCGKECKFDPNKRREPGQLEIGYLIDKDGGHELGVFQGTISVDSVRFTKVGQSAWEFEYRGFGRPNAFLEGGFQLMHLRRSRYIWHEVKGRISCEDVTSSIQTELGGSYFPSHRQWVRGDVAHERSQGVLTDLWQADSSDPDLVNGQHVTTPGPVPGFGFQPEL